MADLLARVERGVGVLEHHLHLAAQALVLRAVARRHPLLAHAQPPLGGRLDQGELARQRALAAARFAHHRQRLAGFKVEGHILQGAHGERGFHQALADAVVARQALGLHHGVRHAATFSSVMG